MREHQPIGPAVSLSKVKAETLQLHQKLGAILSSFQPQKGHQYATYDAADEGLPLVQVLP